MAEKLLTCRQAAALYLGDDSKAGEFRLRRMIEGVEFARKEPVFIRTGKGLRAGVRVTEAMMRRHFPDLFAAEREADLQAMAAMRQELERFERSDAQLRKAIRWLAARLDRLEAQLAIASCGEL